MKPDTYDVFLHVYDNRDNSLTDTLRFEVRNPVVDTPLALPARILSWKFNKGGEGLGYHDHEPLNRGDANIRMDEGVDIEKCPACSSGYDVAYIENGEWLAYAVSAPKDTAYQFTISVASGAKGPFRCHLEIDRTNVTGPINFNFSDGWQNWHELTFPGILIKAGTHELREVSETGDFNFKDIVISEYSSKNATATQCCSLRCEACGKRGAALGNGG